MFLLCGDVLCQFFGFVFGFVGVVMFGGMLSMMSLVFEVFDLWFIVFGCVVIVVVLVVLFFVFFCWLFLLCVACVLFLIVVAGTVIGFPAFSAFALLTVPVLHGAVVLGLLSFAIAVAAVVVNGERSCRVFWAWSVLGAAIVMVMVLRDAEGVLGWGDVFFLFVGASAAIGYVYYVRIAPWVSGWESIFWVLVVCVLLIFGVCAVIWWLEYFDALLLVVFGFFYIVFFFVFIGFFFWNVGMVIGGVARVA